MKKNRKAANRKPQSDPQSTTAPEQKPEPAPSAPCDTCRPLKELKAEAKDLKIRYFSRMKRPELEEAVQCAREQGKENLARLKKLEELGKERSDALWAAWRKKQGETP